jgi:hypothetical protein
LAYSTLGNWEKTQEAYKSAALCGEARPIPLMNWLQVSLLLGDRRSVLEASGFMEDTVPEDHPSVDSFTACISEQLKTDLVSPRQDFGSFVAGLEDRLDQTSLEIANALAQKT